MQVLYAICTYTVGAIVWSERYSGEPFKRAMPLPSYFPPASATPDAGSKNGNVALKRSETAFIEGYDDAVVKSNIHYPAEAKPLRASHTSNVNELDSIAALTPASKRS